MSTTQFPHSKEDAETALGNASAAGNTDAIEAWTQYLKEQGANTAAKAEPRYTAQQYDYGEMQDEASTNLQSSFANAGKVMNTNQQEFQTALQDKAEVLRPQVEEGTLSPDQAAAQSLLGSRDPIESHYSQDARPQSVQELAVANLGEAIIPAAGDVMIEGAKIAGKVLSNVTPDVIENPTVNAVIDIGQAISELPTVQEMIELAKENYPKYLAMAKEYPHYDRMIKNVFSIASLGTNTKVEAGLDAMGVGLKASASKSTWKTRREGVQNMLAPIHPETSDMTTTMSPTRTEGMFNSIKPNYTDQAEEIIDITAMVPKLKPNGSFTGSRNIIYDEITSTASKLKTDILAAGNPKLTVDVATQLQDAMDIFPESVGFGLAGGTPKFATDLMTTAIRLVKESDGTAAGVLEARKKLDKFINKHQPKSLTQEYINSKAVAVSEIRTIMNDAVAGAVPDVKVKELLAKQHKLYKAWDVTGDKAINESRNAVGRLWQKVTGGNVSIPKTPMALRALGGGLAYWVSSGNAVYALGGIAAATAGVVGYDVLTGPKLRQTLGSLLTDTSKLIKTTKDTTLLKQLKADRLIVIGLLTDLEKTSERPPLKGAANQ
jgi:hypothetical protein